MTAPEILFSLQSDLLKGDVSDEEWIARRFEAANQREQEVKEAIEKLHDPETCFLCQEERVEA